MTWTGVVQIAALLLVVLAVVKPLGLYMARVFAGERTLLSVVMRWPERAIYRVAGIDEHREQSWISYAVSLLLFSFFGLLLLYLLQRLQGGLPLNPEKLGGVKPDTAFNTAVSFTSNTNWQSYTPESTVSYLTQTAGLTVQNFLSASVGIGVALALIRGIVRQRADSIGNFWVDMVRANLYVLLPIAVVLALLLSWQGVPQNLHSYVHARTLEGAVQTIAQGPVATQEAIKELGTNGGGFFNANSAHPYENPTPITNFVEMLAILAIPAALTYTFGRMAGDTRQGWALLAAMVVLFLLGVGIAYWAESRPNPALSGLHVDQAMGNMEGKETRFGAGGSALWAVVTTGTSTGAVNSMHDSFNPLGGMIPLAFIELGEVVFGGVGTGLAGMLFFALLAVFLAGLMVGRTPEYLGKKVQAFEVKMVALAILIFPASVLALTALASATDWGTSGLNNSGPHGFTEMLYAFSSATGNNGSAFAGLNASSNFYNLVTGVAMFIGRFLVIIPTLAVAGSLAKKQPAPPSLGTFPTTGLIWVGLLAAVVLIVGLLTFFPALALGPVVEQFMANAGRTF